MTAKESKAVAWSNVMIPAMATPDQIYNANSEWVPRSAAESALHAAEAELGELRQRVGVVAADLETEFTSIERMPVKTFRTIKKKLTALKLLASDGGAGGDNEGEGK